jgi:hypothetical protein
MPDLKDPSAPDIKMTAVKKNSKHPIYEEQFQWEVRAKDIDLVRVTLNPLLPSNQPLVISNGRFESKTSTV